MHEDISLVYGQRGSNTQYPWIDGGEMKKAIYSTIGFLSLSFACVGALLPLIPTTPFLLFSMFCFAKSSERLSKWFVGTKMYKKHLESFARGQGMKLGTKWRVIGMVTILFSIAFYMMQTTTIGRVVILLLWVAHVVGFLFFVKTDNELKEAKKVQLL